MGQAEALKERLQQILDLAHSAHRYITDREQYGVTEHWRPGLVGDCEDFALWVRDRLSEQGVNADLIYCGVDSPIGDHLVCSVDGWILDNRYHWVMARDELRYTWISIGKPDGRWYEITG